MFDAYAAAKATATLPEKFLGTFMAMPPELREQCVKQFNALFQDMATCHTRYQIIKIEGKA